MSRLYHVWAQAVVRFRIPVLLVTATLLALATTTFRNLYHDDSNESYFLEGDPNLAAYNKLHELFGDNEYLLIGVPAPAGQDTVFEARTIEVIQEITAFLEEHEVVTQVRSLSKYEHTHNSDGTLATDPLFEEFDDLTQAVLSHAQTVIQGEPLALDSLITRDLKHTVIAARTELRPKENAHKVQVVTDTLNFIQEKHYASEGYNLHISGDPLIGERFENLTKSDMAWLNPAMAIIIVGILLLVFRSIVATVLPLVFIGITVVLVTGLQGFLVWPFTAVNSALIPTTIILSVGTCVHIMVEFFNLRRNGATQKAAAQKTVEHLFFPVFFTCLTTGMGFIALSVTDIMPVKQFALLAASTSMLIFLLSMTLLPAILSFTPWIAKGGKTGHQHRGFVSQFLHALPQFVFKNRKPLAVIGILFSLFSVFSIRFMQVDTNFIEYFKQDSAVAKDLRYFDEQFKGIGNLEVIIDSGSEGGIKNPEFLQRIDDLEQYFEGYEESGNPVSVVKFFKQINQALHQDDANYFALPTTSPMAAQFLLLYENTGPEEDLSDLKDYDERYLRLSVSFINMNAADLEKQLDKIRQDLAQNFDDIAIELTGGLVIFNAIDTYVNRGMAQSFALAIAIIAVSFLLLFRSIKYGLIALIPSVVPVLITGGLISLAGVSLNLGTMIVGAMTIGIAVDDSIHLMSRYILHRKRGENVFEAISAALATTGKAVILTSLILVTGFSIMLFGSFIPFIQMGLFSAMIMIFALLGDLIFLPALLFLLDRNTPSHIHEQVPQTKTQALTPEPEDPHHVS